MKGVSVSLKDESNTVLTSGLTDSNGMITFSYNTNISRKTIPKSRIKILLKKVFIAIILCRMPTHHRR